MRFLHAPAPALAGCFLMVPIPDIGGPIAKWDHYAAFESEAACEAQRLKVIESNQADFELMGFSDQEVKHALLQSQCVASDDPRLKGS